MVPNSLALATPQTADVPALLKNGFPEQDAYFKKLQAEYDAYNIQCEQDKVDMTLVKSDNIASKLTDWTFHENYDYMEKVFEFATFEQAQDFINKVGVFCEKMDHHPEWNSSNNGTTLNVRLTSHFNDNKVSLNDLELAQHMNSVQKGGSMSWLSLDDFRGLGLATLVGAGALVLLKVQMDKGKKPAPQWTLESVQKRQASVSEE